MKSNLEHLRDIIHHLSVCHEFDKGEAFEFIEAAENDAAESKSLLDSVKAHRDNLQEDLNELSLEEGVQCTEEIYCGIGKIHWSTDNLKLQLLMEALAERIQREGAAKVLDALQDRSVVHY